MRSDVNLQFEKHIGSRYLSDTKIALIFVLSERQQMLSFNEGQAK